MRTGISVSKTKKKLSTIAAIVSSATTITLAICFVTMDYISFSPKIDKVMLSLQPTRSDTLSEPDNNNSVGDENVSNNSEPSLNSDSAVPKNNDNGNSDDNTDNSNVDKPTIDISMDIVKFKANSAEYVDENNANDVLINYIKTIDSYFITYPDSKIYLVGCIARTRNWKVDELELSQQRANAVRDSLITLGVDANKLVAIGIGPNDPWRNNEWADGYFDESIAKTNRRVWIIPDVYEDQLKLVLDTQKEVTND